jgi:hypothetical protein
MLGGILQRQPGWSFVSFYTLRTVTALGVALVPFVALGVYTRLIAPWRERRVDGKWASLAALIFSVWLFHCLVPAAAAEMRYLIAVMLPMTMFLVAGMHVAAQYLRVSAITPPRRPWVVAAAVIAIFLATGFSIPKKTYHGFDQVAERLERPEYSNSVILVSSGAVGEGMLIAEMAMREKRPSHVILRATKMLSQSDWNGMHYELTYHTPEELMEFLRNFPVDIVVIDNEGGRAPLPHHLLLKQAVAAFPAEWEQLGSYPQNRAAAQPTIDLYRLKTASRRSPVRIHIDMPFTLRRPIVR